MESTQVTVKAADKAFSLILKGNAPAGLTVNGVLDFSNTPSLVTLPEGLTVRRLVLDECSNLCELPRGLHCYELSARATALRTLPDDIQVSYRLDLSGCDMLESLPEKLKVGSLILRECTALRSLPQGLDVAFLDMPGCVSITDFPARGSVRMGRLNMRGCTAVRALPPWLKEIAGLDISGCIGIGELPEGLQVCSWLDIAHTQVRKLPLSLKGVQLRWRDVPINERIAFSPDTITTQEVLDTTNVELRRVLLERLGYERFIDQCEAEVLDRDSDPGGERRLLRVNMQRDEPLVCLAVLCPSTGRRYLLRVPPTIRTCHQAAAWIAGFDNPDDYRPVLET